MIQIVKIPIINGRMNDNVYNNQLDGYLTKEEFTSRLKSFDLLCKIHQKKYVHRILLPFLLPIFCIMIILSIFIINHIQKSYSTTEFSKYIGLVGVISTLIFLGCMIWYCITSIKFKEKIKREIKFLVTTFNEYDYTRHVQWRVIKERNTHKTIFSNYTEFLTIDIVDDSYFYYSISSRSSSNVSLLETLNSFLNDGSLLNENLSLTPPPPAYYSSPNTSTFTIDIINDNNNHPPFLLNIPPPPPPTYQEALKCLDGGRILFIERRGEENGDVYFGMGRRGSVIRGWL